MTGITDNRDQLVNVALDKECAKHAINVNTDNAEMWQQIP